MKKKLQTLALSVLLSATGLQAQNVISDFENLVLPPPPAAQYWNGNDLSGGFTNGVMYFKNNYDTSWGGLWVGGFAYSAMTDTVTSGFGNMYSAKTGSGNNGSTIYAIGQQNAVVLFDSTINLHGLADGFYVTNTTYAYNSMRDGDMFSRKFGDTTGTNSGLPQGSYPDFFKLTVLGYNNGSITDSAEFYLADYRFTNDSLDYIVNTWEYVDCSPLGIIDSLKFVLTSSDMGPFGMNTPAFFGIDDLSITPDLVGISNTTSNNQSFMLYPNPTSGNFYVKSNNESLTLMITLFDINGKTVFEKENIRANQPVDISTLAAGIYTVKFTSEKGTEYTKLIKD